MEVGALKVIRYARPDGSVGVGVVEGDTVYAAGDDLTNPQRGERAGLISELTLHAPVSGIGKIVCIGMNYVDHAEELGVTLPDVPTMFAKFNNAIVGPDEQIRVPAFAPETDYEAELGVIIGRRAVDVTPDEALDYVFGYTVVNDVSARDLQFDPSQSGQWLRGKSVDTYCPVGPWIVTKDEVSDPQSLGIRCLVNDVLLQNSSTKQMYKSVAELVSIVSSTITLEPGDLIATGTPGGVGFKRNPAVYLKDGDVVRVEIDGVGELSNPVVARA
jgi:2-keto-4-pentenoate hydratase/2-oxohepta-3-ene-1,7-dioic acid hydratase in catechol pathway